METLVLCYVFADDTSEHEKEFIDLPSVKKWLDGQRETDFSSIDLYDNNQGLLVIEGWSNIHQYISENTGPILPTYNQSHSWEDSEFIVDPFDTYEQGELLHNLSQCGEATVKINEMGNPNFI